MYREKVNFIDVRQRFLTSPEHRLKASAKTGTFTQDFIVAIVLFLELQKKNFFAVSCSESCLLHSITTERGYTDSCVINSPYY